VNKTPSGLLRYWVHYTGRVQGVGFRYTVQRISRDFHVDGFVRNLPDGRVELVIEGTKKELDCFLAEIDQIMAENIATTNTTPLTATGEFAGGTLSIRH